MANRKFSPEQVVAKLRQIEVLTAGGKSIPQACKEAGITDVTYYRWRKEYSGLKASQAKKLKDLERENQRLKKLVADLSLEKAILKDVAEGNFYDRRPGGTGAGVHHHQAGALAEAEHCRRGCGDRGAIAPAALAELRRNAGLFIQQTGHNVDPAGIEAIAFGAVVPERGKPNIAREIVFEAGLPASIEAQTVSSYCITGLRTATIIADAIARGRISAGIAGGVEWLSGADPATFCEPTTGLSMGEHMEITRKQWEIPRTRQDEIALASHRNAVAAADKLAAEIVPLEGVAKDSGPRPDTSFERLATLKPAFGADGTITAGNASPVTDGASAVLLMSEERAQREGRRPLAFIEAMDYAALHPDEGLLMAPAITGRASSHEPGSSSPTSICSRSTRPSPRRYPSSRSFLRSSLRLISSCDIEDHSWLNLHRNAVNH